MVIFLFKNCISMIKVGITGGIGSGKSYVCRIIESMGYPVYYSDLESKVIMDNDPEIRLKLISLLGTEAYINNRLNRKFLADQLFKSDEIRKKVNAIVHPKVRAYFDDWCTSQYCDIVFNEAAILFETQSYKQFNKTILVSAPEIVKIERIIMRDQLSLEEIKQRMSKQWTDEQKTPLADFVINNDGSPLLSQIEDIIQEIKETL